jgi:heme-degrading monooxygenase HmoA
VYIEFSAEGGTGMFCGMAMSTPRHGKEEALAAAAAEHAEALRRQPGCVSAYVMKERGSGMQISLSIFDSEESFNQAMEATVAIIARHHLENLRDGPSAFRVFEVR